MNGRIVLCMALMAANVVVARDSSETASIVLEFRLAVNSTDTLFVCRINNRSGVDVENIFGGAGPYQWVFMRSLDVPASESQWEVIFGGVGPIGESGPGTLAPVNVQAGRQAHWNISSGIPMTAAPRRFRLRYVGRSYTESVYSEWRWQPFLDALPSKENIVTPESVHVALVNTIDAQINPPHVDHESKRVTYLLSSVVYNTEAKDNNGKVVFSAPPPPQRAGLPAAQRDG